MCLIAWVKEIIGGTEYQKNLIVHGGKDKKIW